MNLGPVAKALVGATLAGVAPYTSAVQPWSQDGAHVTLGEWGTIAGAILVASRLVWQADNLRWFKYAKATATALVVFLGPLTVLLLADRTVTVPDILDALVKVALSFGIVSQVPNADRSEWHDSIGNDGEPEPFDYRTATDDDLIDYNGQEQDDLEADEHDVEADSHPEPVDADGDGHDDRTGHWTRGNMGGRPLARGGIVPAGSLALLLGGAVLTLEQHPHRRAGYLV